MPKRPTPDEHEAIRAHARELADELMDPKHHPHDGRWRCVVCAAHNWSCVRACEKCKTEKPTL